MADSNQNPTPPTSQPSPPDPASQDTPQPVVGADSPSADESSVQNTKDVFIEPSSPSPQNESDQPSAASPPPTVDTPAPPPPDPTPSQTEEIPQPPPETITPSSPSPVPELDNPPQPANIQDNKPLEEVPPPSPEPSAASPPPPPPDQPPPPPAVETPDKPDKTPDPNIKRSPFRIIGPLLLILIIGLFAFVIIRFILPRLQSSTPELSSDVNLVYWGLWEPTENLQAIFSQFEAQHQGVTITYTQQSPKDYRERVQSTISRGQGPDIFRFHNTWTPMLKDNLNPLPGNIMSSSEFESTFYPITHKDLRQGTSYIGIPLEIDGLALYYNKRILESAGKTPPTNWVELRRTAAELTLRDEEDRIIRSGVAIGTTSNIDHWSDIVGLMLLQNGANPAEPEDAAAQDAIAFYTIFTKTDRIWDDTLPTSTVAFANEKAVMMLAPSWRALDVKALNPDLEFATAPVPQLPNTNISWASYWVEGVSSQSSPEKQAAAWQLIKFLSEKEQMQNLYNTASQTRLFGEPYSRVDLADELAADPIVGSFITSASTAQSWYLSSWTHDNGLNDRIIKYYEDAINIVNQGKSPDKALETTVDGVAQVLSQYAVSGVLRQ